MIGLDKVREVCSNPHHILSVTSARTTDGHVIVTGSTDGKIRMRHSENPTYELEFEGHSDIVCAVVPSPGNDVLASASYDRTLRLWNLKARRKIGRLEHSAGVSCAAFAGGGALLATGTCDGKIYVWEITDLLQHATNVSTHMEHHPIVTNAFMNQVHDNEANNEGVNVKLLHDVCGDICRVVHELTTDWHIVQVGVIDSTIPTIPTNHPTSRYGVSTTGPRQSFNCPA